MANIGIACCEFFCSNSSGIYTFLKHTIKALHKLGHQVYLLLDTPSSFSEEQLGDYCGFINGTGKWSNKLASDMVEIGKLDLVITNSLESSRAFIGVDIRKAIYTHIGDLFHSDSENHDFLEKDTRDYLDIFNMPEFDILTQTEGLSKMVKSQIDREATVCYEPYFEDDIDIYNIYNGDLIVISGNYKRKNIIRALEIAAELSVSITVLTNQNDGYINIYDEAERLGLEKIRVIENYPNKYIPIILKAHKALIHMSKIEVCPYGCIEAMSSGITAIVNRNTVWGDAFLDDAVKISDDNIDKVKDVLNNPKKYNSFTLERYQETFFRQWDKYIKGE